MDDFPTTPETVRITFRGLTPPKSAEPAIHERIEELGAFAPQIMSCQVVVEVPHHHHRHGNQYHVQITLRLPGDEVVVSHQPTQHGTERHLQDAAHRKATELGAQDRSLYTAIHEAFDLARRQLQDSVRRRRGKVKTHQPSRRGG